MSTKILRYAIPTVNGELAMHFGHCETICIGRL